MLYRKLFALSIKSLFAQLLNFYSELFKPREKLKVDSTGKLTQTYLGDIMGSVPDHYNKVSGNLFCWWKVSPSVCKKCQHLLKCNQAKEQ